MFKLIQNPIQFMRLGNLLFSKLKMNVMNVIVMSLLEVRENISLEKKSEGKHPEKLCEEGKV